MIRVSMLFEEFVEQYGVPLLATHGVNVLLVMANQASERDAVRCTARLSAL
jgi:hypothetical protein